jgi:hypothetical protein
VLSNRDTATQIHALIQKASEHIRQSIDLARDQLTDESFHKYCHTVGTVLAELQLELLKPHVYAAYPDLAPKPPADPADGEFIDRLGPKFIDAARRARG